MLFGHASSDHLKPLTSTSDVRDINGASAEDSYVALRPESAIEPCDLYTSTVSGAQCCASHQDCARCMGKHYIGVMVTPLRTRNAMRYPLGRDAMILDFSQWIFVHHYQYSLSEAQMDHCPRSDECKDCNSHERHAKSPLCIYGKAPCIRHILPPTASGLTIRILKEKEAINRGFQHLDRC